MTDDRIKLSQGIAGYITDVYQGRRERDYRLMHDSYDLKMVFLQALQCVARTDDISILGNEWYAVETIISHLSVKGDIAGNEMERTTVKVAVTVCTVIDGEIKLRSLTIVYMDADYVNQYAGSYLPVWMIAGAYRVLQLIKLEIRRKPKYSFN